MKLLILLIISSVATCLTDEDEDMKKKSELALMARECIKETGVANLPAKYVIVGDLSKINEDDIKAKVN